MVDESNRYVGRSAAEAAIKACERLGITRSELKYEVISEEGEGLSRRVTIVVKNDPPAAAPSKRPSAPVKQQAPAASAANSESTVEGRPERKSSKETTRRAKAPSDVPASVEKVSSSESSSSANSGRAVQARETLNRILSLMDFNLRPTVISESPEEIQIDLVGVDEERAIGRTGETLLSLQFLVNRIVSNREASETPSEQVIVLDSAGYRRRRKGALEELARRLAIEVLREHRPVRLSPMSAHDRRVFHLALADESGVVTRSQGDGLYRRLLILPA